MPGRPSHTARLMCRLVRVDLLQLIHMTHPEALQFFSPLFAPAPSHVNKPVPPPLQYVLSNCIVGPLHASARAGRGPAVLHSAYSITS
jgi:hypothetical protein